MDQGGTNLQGGMRPQEAIDQQTAFISNVVASLSTASETIRKNQLLVFKAVDDELGKKIEAGITAALVKATEEENKAKDAKKKIEAEEKIAAMNNMSATTATITPLTGDQQKVQKANLTQLQTQLEKIKHDLKPDTT